MIEIIIEPGKKYKWDRFIEEKGKYSIALDGIVIGPTTRRPDLPAANFDHHVECDRLATLATCGQVAMEINLGLMKMFQIDGIPTAKVYVNDVDEDVCLATWLLLNHELVDNHGNPLINRLIYCQDKLDATAGMYPFGDTTFRRQLAWIMHPYQEARYSGALHGIDAEGMRAILEAVHARITDYVMGKGKEKALKGEFEVMKRGKNWSLVKEKGPAARIAMLGSGIDAFVVYRYKEVKGNKDIRYHYSIGRQSVWVDFDILKLLEALSEEEHHEDPWGGSNTIGGSPRTEGSTLPPERVFEIIEKALSEK